MCLCVGVSTAAFFVLRVEFFFALPKHKQKTQAHTDMLTEAWNTLLINLVKSVNDLVTTEQLTALLARLEDMDLKDDTLMQQFRVDAQPVSDALAESNVACFQSLGIFQGCQMDQVFGLLSDVERANTFAMLQDLYNRAALEKTCRAGISDVQQLCAETIQNAEALGVDLKDPMQAMPALLRGLCTGDGFKKVSQIVDTITRKAESQDILNLLNFNGAGAIGEKLAAEMKRAESAPAEEQQELAAPKGFDQSVMADLLSPENIAKMMQSAMKTHKPGTPLALRDLFAQMNDMFPSAAEQVD